MSQFWSDAGGTGGFALSSSSSSASASAPSLALVGLREPGGDGPVEFEFKRSSAKLLKSLKSHSVTEAFVAFYETRETPYEYLFHCELIDNLAEPTEESRILMFEAFLNKRSGALFVENLAKYTEHETEISEVYAFLFNCMQIVTSRVFLPASPRRKNAESAPISVVGIEVDKRDMKTFFTLHPYKLLENILEETHYTVDINGHTYKSDRIDPTTKHRHWVVRIWNAPSVEAVAQQWSVLDLQTMRNNREKKQQLRKPASPAPNIKSGSGSSSDSNSSNDDDDDGVSLQQQQTQKEERRRRRRRRTDARSGSADVTTATLGSEWGSAPAHTNAEHGRPRERRARKSRTTSPKTPSNAGVESASSSSNDDDNDDDSGGGTAAARVESTKNRLVNYGRGSVRTSTSTSSSGSWEVY